MNVTAVDVLHKAERSRRNGPVWRDNKNGADSEQLMCVCQHLKGKLEAR